MSNARSLRCGLVPGFSGRRRVRTVSASTPDNITRVNNPRTKWGIFQRSRFQVRLEGIKREGFGAIGLTYSLQHDLNGERFAIA